MAVQRATACLVAAWLATATVFQSSRSFVQSGAPRSSGLGSQPSSALSHKLQFQSFQESASSNERASHWASVASVAAAVGLVLGMMSIPANAEDAVAPATEAAPAAAPAATEQVSPKKKKLAQRKEAERERRALVKEKKAASGPTFGAAGGSPSSFNAPAQKTSTGRVYYNASEQLADDEISFDAWLLKNPIPFLALILGPSFVYLGFFVAGSLNII
eukprot:CAMPEP_0170592896 /NCGR_PEP_ID=MMETSP0224-20130122/13162_1 /TAXON_ID=285029 /ORGANISM="Togula jolla, Strain CCCM 725" /LENGTH=216 /DNA_ID=CAMNT_0010916819 /DNA_START=68 /DNA_END=718 /DNA_ORIENTATION=+